MPCANALCGKQTREGGEKVALVVRVIGDCPSCGLQNGFGNVGVHGDHVLRGCKRCGHLERVPLPPVKKKVLYLDQSLLSAAFRENDTAAVTLIERVKNVAQDQLLVVPYSSVHEDETYMLQLSKPDLVDPLMNFIKQTCGGHQFEPAWRVEHKQIHDAYGRWLNDKPTHAAPDRRDAIEDDVDDWSDYFFIDVPGYFHDPVVNATNKSAALGQLLDAIELWRNSNLSFDDAIQFELLSAGEEYIQAYVRMIQETANGNELAPLTAPIITRVVGDIISGCDGDETVKRIKGLPAFFRSEHFSECPYQWLSVRMFAVLRHQVQHEKAYTNRKKAEKKLLGFTHDVRHIATFAPYCDAIFVDNAMAHILRDSRVAIEKRYETKVFSRRNQSEFESWLSEMEGNMDKSHRAALRTIHPERDAEHE